MFVKIAFFAVNSISSGVLFLAAFGGLQQMVVAQTKKTEPQEVQRQSSGGQERSPGFSSNSRLGQANKIAIQTDEKLGRYLPNSRCRVQLIHDIEVPALEAGQITKILVDENQAVTPETVIAQLLDDAAVKQKDVAVKNRNVALVDAENPNRVDYARKSLEFAQDIMVRKDKLYKELGSINFVEFREAQYQESQAKLQLDESLTQKKVAKEKLAVEEVNIMAAEDLIQRHKVRSLLEKGEVAEIFVQVGEWVNRGDKVARVIDMENLKITGRADSREIYPEQIAGRPVIVNLPLPNNKFETFKGEVVRINLENSVSDKYYFQVNIDNRKRGDFWILRPNAEVEIKVLLDRQE